MLAGDVDTGECLQFTSLCLADYVENKGLRASPVNALLIMQGVSSAQDNEATFLRFSTALLIHQVTSHLEANLPTLQVISLFANDCVLTLSSWGILRNLQYTHLSQNYFSHKTNGTIRMLCVNFLMTGFNIVECFW
jgi:hypothetical protein